MMLSTYSDIQQVGDGSEQAIYGKREGGPRYLNDIDEMNNTEVG